MFTKENHIRKVLLILIVVSTIIRIILALTLELTNDEPNYWLYAKFPAISHYEHPPMIGFIIQLTTLNLTFENEFFLRISSLILGIFNTYLVFAIGRKIKDELTGLYAAFLYTTSFYSFIIAGVFIHPDTPLLFFSLIGLYLLIDGFSNSDIKINTSIMLAGLAIGLAMLSKYTALHLWLGAFLFVIFFKRNWLTRKEIYISALTSVLCIMPVVIWNAVNKSNTLTFWAQNVPAIQTKFSFNFFLPELGGQIFYNNPVNFFIIIFSIIGIKKFHLPNNLKSFLLLTGIPLPLMLLLISLTSRTLPHWSAPGYIPLIIFAAAYLSERHKNKSLIPVSVKISMVFSILIIALATAQINYGIFGSPNPDEVKATELGRKDITLDMYGWRQAGEKFAIINDSLAASGMISKNAPIFSNKWYNAGKVDYYIARKLGKFVFTIGSDVEIRKYDWVNRERGGYQNVTEAYYISPSRDYQDPKEKYGTLFSSIIPVDTIRVERCGHIVENMFVYVMKK